MQRGPGAELRDLERQLADAVDDEERAAIDARIDDLFAEAREGALDLKRREQQAFSSGARRPLQRESTVSERMNAALLQAYTRGGYRA